MNRPELKNDITELLDRDFTCRLVKDNDEDIIKALNCIYSHYKYDYLHQALYDLDYFKDVIRNGRFRNFCSSTTRWPSFPIPTRKE